MKFILPASSYFSDMATSTFAVPHVVQILFLSCRAALQPPGARRGQESEFEVMKWIPVRETVGEAGGRSFSQKTGNELTKEPAETVWWGQRVSEPIFRKEESKDVGGNLGPREVRADVGERRMYWASPRRMGCGTDIKIPPKEEHLWSSLPYRKSPLTHVTQNNEPWVTKNLHYPGSGIVASLGVSFSVFLPSLWHYTGIDHII
jgi:hypothetical protein